MSQSGFGLGRLYTERGSLLPRLPVDSFMDKVEESEGEFGSGGTLGAKLVEDELPCELPVGDVGCAPFGAPGLLVPPFLPPPRKRPLLQRKIC